MDDRFAHGHQQAIACADGNATLKDAKPALRAALAAARETGDADPVAQAAARAISTACGVIQTPTNTLASPSMARRPQHTMRPGYPPTRRSMSVWRIWNSIESSRHCGMRPLMMSQTLSRCGGTAEPRLATPLTQITARVHDDYSNAVNSSNAGPAMTPPTSVSSMPRNTIGRAGPSDQPC